MEGHTSGYETARLRLRVACQPRPHLRSLVSHLKRSLHQYTGLKRRNSCVCLWGCSELCAVLVLHRSRRKQLSSENPMKRIVGCIVLPMGVPMTCIVLIMGALYFPWFRWGALYLPWAQMGLPTGLAPHCILIGHSMRFHRK